LWGLHFTAVLVVRKETYPKKETVMSKPVKTREIIEKQIEEIKRSGEVTDGMALVDQGWVEALDWVLGDPPVNMDPPVRRIGE
jgi:hypothetical protein